MAQQKVFVPVGSRVALEEIPEEMTAGGVLIPDSVVNRPTANKSWVVAVGPECKLLKEGDLVLHGSIVGQRLVYGGSTLFVCKEEHIEGVVIGKNRLEKSESDRISDARKK